MNVCKAHPFLINALFTTAAIILAISQQNRRETSFAHVTSSATGVDDWTAQATRSKAAKHSSLIHSAQPPIHTTKSSIQRSAAVPSKNSIDEQTIKCPSNAPITHYSTQNITMASSISIGYL